MAKMAQWFRFYDDFFHHLKTRRLKNPLFKLVVIAGWAIASRSPERGKLLIGSERLPADAEDIANEADIPVEIVVEALGTKEKPGPVTKDRLYLTWDENGVLYSPTWPERQFGNDPTNAERQRRHRETQKENPSKKEPASDNDRNALRNVTNNASDTDSDTDLRVVVDSAIVAKNAVAKAECLALVNRHFVKWVLSGETYRSFLQYEDKLSWTLMLKAVQLTMAADKGHLKYCIAILEKWAEAGLKTPEDADIHEARWKEEQERGRARKGGPNSHQSRTTSLPKFQGVDPDEILRN